MAIAKVLIVDDEPPIRNLLGLCVSNCGFQTVLASDAREAMNLLDDSHFDLLVSDVRMPGMDGMQLLSWTEANHRETGVIMLSGNDDLRQAVQAMRLGALDYLQKPFNVADVSQTLHEALRRHRERLDKARQVLDLETALKAKADELRATLGQLQEASEGALEALVTALDAREHETLAHSERVSLFTVRLAEEIGVHGEELEVIRKGAMLHDVGKIGIADAILLKPGTLTAEEWTEMRQHPLIGSWIVEGVPSLKSAASVVLSHHEKFDGTGYPRNLRGHQIPLGARVFSVADTLDAITSDRPYHRSRSIEDAREEIRLHAGSQFDPDIVECFLNLPASEWADIRERVGNSKDRSADFRSMALI
jgi:response regulator RpfG family c-di-GMP phosphodiesterase